MVREIGFAWLLRVDVVRRMQENLMEKKKFLCVRRKKTIFCPCERKKYPLVTWL